MLKSHTRLNVCYLKVFSKILWPCLLPKHNIKESPMPSCQSLCYFFNLDKLRDKCALNWYQGNKLMACSTDLISMGTSQYYTHILLKEKCLISRSQWTSCVYYIKTERWTRFFPTFTREENEKVFCRIKGTLLSIHPCINSKYPTEQMTHRGAQTDISHATF